MNNKKLLKEWQKRLNLLDWRIHLYDNCAPDEMHVDESSGCVSWAESTKTACIQILDPRFYGERVAPFDYEQVLVHELLHLKFCLLYDEEGELRERLVHQILDEISRALVEAKRMVPKDV